MKQVVIGIAALGLVAAGGCDWSEDEVENKIAERDIKTPAPPAPVLDAATAKVVDEAGLARAMSARQAPEPAAASAKEFHAPAFLTGVERYPNGGQNAIQLVEDAPVSTFSIDVDTASYANVRRLLAAGERPPVDAVRIEELINYFDYAYGQPAEGQPAALDLALFASPWNDGAQLLRIGLQSRTLPAAERLPVNLVFLVDTSGSMDSPDKLPLLKRSLRLLVAHMTEKDRIAIVAYAGAAGMVLEATPGDRRAVIEEAIERLSAGGGTGGAGGLELAYQVARTLVDTSTTTRVMLATDGDFNLGLTDPDQLEDVIAAKRAEGVYLSILGFGQGNLNDLLMQRLAQAGNGNASYIDSLMEAQKVLVEEIGELLLPVADDVKVQIEFNPALVAEYRLIGYETRLLDRTDFNNDQVDAGELGSNHQVTALYEITAPRSLARRSDPLRYGRIVAAAANEPRSDELAWLRLRYKKPGSDTSEQLEMPIMADSATAFQDAPDDARFAAAVAGFGQILRQDTHVGRMDLETVATIARKARGTDAKGYRAEFVRLVELARQAEWDLGN